MKWRKELGLPGEPRWPITFSKARVEAWGDVGRGVGCRHNDTPQIIYSCTYLPSAGLRIKPSPTINRKRTLPANRLGPCLFLLLQAPRRPFEP